MFAPKLIEISSRESRPTGAGDTAWVFVGSRVMPSAEHLIPFRT